MLQVEPSRCLVISYGWNLKSSEQMIYTRRFLKMCTSFAVYSQKKAVYGMNFDTDDIDLKLKVSN